MHMGTYQKVAILDATSGIRLEAYDSRDALLIGLLEGCDMEKLAQLRASVIPKLEATRARLEAESEARSDGLNEEEDGW